MKKIYFVRHGESEGNAGPIRDDGMSSLTENGRRQAEFVAERIQKLPIECVIASTMPRAKETAEIIAKRIQKDFVLSDIFVERRRPSDQLGKPKDDRTARESEKLIEENLSVPGYRYSDEETVADIRERARKAIELLEARPEEHILVVTHGVFLRALLAYIVLGPDFTELEYSKIHASGHMENTGLTIFCHNPKSKHPWFLWVWNDHAHLA